MGQCASSLQHCKETATAPTTSSTVKSNPKSISFKKVTKSDRDLCIDSPQKEIPEDALGFNKRAKGTKKKKIRKSLTRRSNFREQDRKTSSGCLTASRRELIKGDRRARPCEESAWEHLGYEWKSKSTKDVGSSRKGGPTHTSIGSWGSLSIQEGILQKDGNKVDKVPLLEISMNDVSGNTVPTQFDYDDISDLDSQWDCIPITTKSNRRRSHTPDLSRRASPPTYPIIRKPSHRSSIYLPKNPARSKVSRNSIGNKRSRQPSQRKQKQEVAAHPKTLSPWNPHRLPSTKDYREQLR